MTKVKQGTIIYYDDENDLTPYIVVSVDEPQMDMVLALRISPIGYNNMARLLINKHNITKNRFTEYENYTLDDVEEYTYEFLRQMEDP